MDSARVFIPHEREDITAQRNRNELPPRFLAFLGKASIKQFFEQMESLCFGKHMKEMI